MTPEQFKTIWETDLKQTRELENDNTLTERQQSYAKGIRKTIELMLENFNEVITELNLPK
jgi:hypothetical protein